MIVLPIETEHQFLRNLGIISIAMIYPSNYMLIFSATLSSQLHDIIIQRIPRESLSKQSPRLQRLNDQSGGTTTTVANTSNTNLSALLLQYTSQGHYDPSTRSTQRVTHGDSSSMNVDLL